MFYSDREDIHMRNTNKKPRVQINYHESIINLIRNAENAEMAYQTAFEIIISILKQPESF